MTENVEIAQSTRRTFLGTAALTAASYQRVLGANDRIGVGFIGFGLIGKQHVADFKKFSDVDIVGVSDTSRSRVRSRMLSCILSLECWCTLFALDQLPSSRSTSRSRSWAASWVEQPKKRSKTSTPLAFSPSSSISL